MPTKARGWRNHKKAETILYPNILARQNEFCHFLKNGAGATATLAIFSSCQEFQTFPLFLLN